LKASLLRSAGDRPPARERPRRRINSDSGGESGRPRTMELMADFNQARPGISPDRAAALATMELNDGGRWPGSRRPIRVRTILRRLLLAAWAADGDQGPTRSRSAKGIFMVPRICITARYSARHRSGCQWPDSSWSHRRRKGWLRAGRRLPEGSRHSMVGAIFIRRVARMWMRVTGDRGKWLVGIMAGMAGTRIFLRQALEIFADGLVPGAYPGTCRHFGLEWNGGGDGSVFRGATMADRR